MKFLKSSGEKLDSEIAAGTGLSLANVRARMLELSAKGEVIMCHSIRYNDGKKVEGMLCRVGCSAARSRSSSGTCTPRHLITPATRSCFLLLPCSPESR